MNSPFCKIDPQARGHLWLGVALLVATAMLCAVSINNAVADDVVTPAAVKSPQGPLQFRRILVPANQPDRWPTEGGRYLPIDQNEFKRLITDIYGKEAGRREAETVRLTDARHAVRAIADDCWVGRSILEIELLRQQPALMRIEPWSAALTAARWAEGNEQANELFSPRGPNAKPAAKNTQPSVATGAIVGNQADGTLAVLVEKSGRLILDWQLLGRRGGSRGVNFDLRLPQTATSEWQFDLPDAFTLTADEARVEALISGTAGNRQRWRMLTGGRTLDKLRLFPRELGPQQRNLNIVRQTDKYRISSRGVEADIHFRLDIHGQPLSELILEVDPQLQIVSAVIGKQPLPWSWLSTAAGAPRRCRLELPGKLISVGQVIEVAAVSPFQIGQRQTLPRAILENVVWQEGAMELLVDAPLELRQLDAEQARQMPRSAGGADAPSPTVVQYFNQRAAVAVLVEYPRNQLTLQTLESMQFIPGEISARAVYDLQCQSGEQSLFVANLEPRWQIDEVESDDWQRLGDWDVEGSEPRRQLKVRLTQSVRADRPVRLIVKGRRSYGISDPLSAADLTMLDFGIAGAERRIWLAEPEGLDWHIVGKEAARRFEPSSIATNDPLIGEVDWGRGWGYYVDSTAATAVQTTLLPRRPKFSAHMSCDVQVFTTSIVETLRVKCLPEGTAMDRLLVHLSRPFGDDQLVWQGDKSLGTIVARKLSADEQFAAGAGTTGQAWELTWRTPLRQPFEVFVQLESAATKPLPVTLMATPEASEQTGEVQLRVAAQAWLQVENNRLQPLAQTALNENAIPASGGSFRYDPRRDGFLESPALLVGPKPLDAIARGAWVWQTTLDTRLSSDGECSNLAVYKIQSAGQTRVELELPAAAELLMLWVNDLQYSPQGSPKNKFVLELPADRARSTISVLYRTKDGLPGLIGSLAPASPNISLPVMSRRWRLWVPPDYRPAGDSPYASEYSRTALTWTQRLLGPLGRSADAGTRNPFRPDFWSFDSRFTGANNAELAIGNRVLRELNNLIVAGDPACATWGGLLQALALQLPELEIGVMPTMLAELGIAADSPVVAESGPGSDRAAGLLRATNGLLLVRGNRVVLAPGLLAAMAHDSIQLDGGSPIAIVQSGQLALDFSQSFVATKALTGDSAQPADLTAARQSATTTRIICSATDWAKWMPTDPKWLYPNVVANGIAEYQGWRLLEFNAVGTAPDFAATVIHESRLTLVLLTLAGSLAICGISLRWAARTGWLIVIATAACLALLLPMGWNLAAAALFCVSSAAALWFVARRKRSIGSRRAAATLAGPATTASRYLVTGGILLAWLALASAQAETLGQAVQQTFFVLIPVDDNQRHVGEKVHVPETFYRNLLAAGDAARGTPRNWLISQARYRLETSADGELAQGFPLTLKAVWNLFVFPGTASVQLPLSGDGVRIDLESARLAGRPITIVEQAGKLLVPITSPGWQRLELNVRLPRQQVGNLWGCELTIPPVANCYVEAKLGPQAQFKLQGVRASVEPAEATEVVTFEAGAIPRLEMQWSEASAGADLASNLEVDELLWVNIRPGSITIDARFFVRVLAGKVRQLRLSTDPGMQLVAARAGDTSLQTTMVVGDGLHVLDLELPAAVTDRVQINLRFLQRDTSGIGNLRFPQCKLLDVTPARRYWAISVDPGLEYQFDVDEQFRPLAIPDFTAAWGELERSPDFCLRELPGEQPLVVATLPRLLRLKSQETLTVVAKREEAECQWIATLEAVADGVLQWRLAVPNELLIDDVAVIANDNDTVETTWSREPATNSLTIRSKEPLFDAHRLKVVGRLRTVPGTPWELPSILLEFADSVRSNALIFRTADVQVLLESTTGWLRDASTVLSVDGNSPGRFVAGLSTVQSPRPVLRLVTAANQPVIHGESALIMNGDDDRWTADLYLKLVVEGGVLDEIKLRAPAGWRQVEALEWPTAAVGIIRETSAAGASQRLISILPREPLSGSVRLVLRGVWEVGDRPQLPNIELLDAQIEENVLLPKHLDMQTLAWRTLGMERRPLEGALGLPPELAETHDTYRVTQGRPQAWTVAIEPHNTSISADLVEHWVVQQDEQHFFGVSRYFLATAGNGRIEIRLPPGAVPVFCQNQSLPLELKYLENDEWACTLPAPQSASQLTLGYKSPRTSTPALGRLNVPVLISADVQMELLLAMSSNAGGELVSSALTRSISWDDYDTQRAAMLSKWQSKLTSVEGVAHSALALRATDENPLSANDPQEVAGGIAETSAVPPVAGNGLAPILSAVDGLSLPSIAILRNGGTAEVSGTSRHRNSSNAITWLLAAMIIVATAAILVHRGVVTRWRPIAAEKILVGLALFAWWWSSVPQVGVILLAILIASLIAAHFNRGKYSTA